MPSLKDLVNNLSNFKYYSGVGTFNANALPYGNDRPNGGSSSMPYIKRKIGDRWSPSNFDDGILPNGIITATSRSTADLLRIGKFLIDAPKGPLWLAKQVGLQMMNPDIQHLSDRSTNNLETNLLPNANLINIAKNGINLIKDTANRLTNEFGPTRIYNPLGLNLLAQVGSNAFGIHFNRHGFLPTLDDRDVYMKTAENSQRLLNLSKKLSSNTIIGNYGNKDNIIESYKGGPNSYLGIGETVIRRTARKLEEDTFGSGVTSVTTEKLFNNFIPIGLDSILKIDNNSNVTYKKYNQKDFKPNNDLKNIDLEALRNGRGSINNDNKIFDFKNEDFRKYKNEINTTDNIKLTYSNYNDPRVGSMEKRIGIIGSRYSNNSNMVSGSREDYRGIGPTDSVNMISLYKATSAGDFTETLDINGNIVNTNTIRDLIKFRIKAFDNDAADPNTGVYMVFRAFITELTDNMNSNWSPYTYVGRGENFYKYEGFESSYNVSFVIAAFSRSEMKPLYQKLNYLKSCMTPDYAFNKMRGNIMELTIGDYVRYQPGIITNMNIGIPREANWEIAIDYFGKDSDMHELPQLLTVNMTFIPIYKFLPRKDHTKSFIGIDDYRRGNAEIGRKERDWNNPALLNKL